VTLEMSSHINCLAYVTETLKWDVHISAMLSKASKRIHFLKQLQRVGVSTADLVTNYSSVICSVMEYACPVWHSSLTSRQSQEIERLQRRALRCILGDVNYEEACSTLGLITLADCREQLTKHFLISSHIPIVVLHIQYHQNAIFPFICIILVYMNSPKHKQLITRNHLYHTVCTILLKPNCMYVILNLRLYFMLQSSYWLQH